MQYFKDTLPTALLVLGSVALLVSAAYFFTDWALLNWGDWHSGSVTGFAKTSGGVRRYQGSIDVRLIQPKGLGPSTIAVSGDSVDLYALNDAIDVIVPPQWLQKVGISPIVKRTTIDYVPVGVFLFLAILLLLSSVAALYLEPKELVVNAMRLFAVLAFVLLAYYQFVGKNKVNQADYIVTQAKFDELFLSEYQQRRSNSEPRGSEYTVRDYFLRVRYFDQNKLEKRYILAAPSEVNPTDLITISYNPKTNHVVLGGAEAIPAQSRTNTVVLLVFGVLAFLLSWFMTR